MIQSNSLFVWSLPRDTVGSPLDSSQRAECVGDIPPSE